MTIGAEGELLTRLYQSSIFQALNSHPLLPCGLRVAVTHPGSLQHSRAAFITCGAHTCSHMHSCAFTQWTQKAPTERQLWKFPNMHRSTVYQVFPLVFQMLQKRRYCEMNLVFVQQSSSAFHHHLMSNQVMNHEHWSTSTNSSCGMSYFLHAVTFIDQKIIWMSICWLGREANFNLTQSKYDAL